MKKAIVILLIVVLCFPFASCRDPAAVWDKIPQNSQASSVTQPPPSASQKPAVTKGPAATERVAPAVQSGPASYSLAHYREVYANPDAYKGKTYESLFQVVSGKQQVEGASVYYANGFTGNSGINATTILHFKSMEAPELSANEVVYARGTVEGKGFLSDGKGNSIDAMWLDVTSIEYDISKANITAQTKEFTFAEGEVVAKNDTLSIEITSLNFTKDNLMLNAKTADTSVKTMETYLFQIIIHQNGYFAWYPGCDIYIQPNGSMAYDSVPFPVMDGTKDITINFVPFGEDGGLLYEPLTVAVKLS